MKAIVAPITIVLAVLSFTAAASASASPGLVIDQANALDERSVVELETELQAIQAETGVESRLVIVRDLDGDSAGVIARRFFAPEPGDQAVLLLVMADREVRIETSGALLNRIPDQTWAQMLTAEMLPALRSVRHGAAVREGVQGLRAVLTGDYDPPAVARGDLSALRDIGVVAAVAMLLALGLFPRSRACIVGGGDWR